MKALIRVAVLVLITMALFAQVLARDSSDPTDVNKLLSDGATEVTVDKLLQEVVFDKTTTDWEVYSDDTTEFTITKGVYQMSLKGNATTWGLNHDSEADTVIQVKTKQVSEDNDNAYGVICRSPISGNGDGYYFQISGDGYYSINRVKSTIGRTLVDWAESKAINQGKDENEITAVCAGNYLAMYVNDVLVAETTDNTFTKGNTGLTVATFGKDVKVDFDDVRVWSASVTGGETAVASNTSSSELPESLTSFDGKPKEAIAELEQLAVIPAGSSQIFNENHAYFTGQGNWFTPLARQSPHKNIVMAGELTFTVGNKDKFESCTLTGRIDTNDRGSATTYIDVGVGNDGYTFIYDLFSEAQNGHLEIGKTSLDLSEPHHLLFTLINDVANVYVDGKLEISGFKVAERSGTYGIALVGNGPKARCDGRNIWAFAVPSVKPGECAVSSTKAANKRTGPGTTFDAAGKLVAGDEIIVIGQAKGSDGKSWWELKDETWVREDLVTTVGDCANVPIVKPS